MVKNSNLANIKPGRIIKNYAAFCNLLGEEVKDSTNSRRAQEKEWQRSLTWKKEGHKYIILEVKKNTEPKNDGRSNGNNNKYNSYTTSILLDHLYKLKLQKKNNDDELFFELTDNKIYLILGLCNERYDRFNHLTEDVGNYRINHVIDFYKRSNNKLYEIRTSTLANLERTGRIKSYNKVRKIYENNVLRSVTQEEELKIKDVELKVLREFKSESIKEIYNKVKQNPFYAKLNKEVKKVFDWTVAFSTNKIILNEYAENEEDRYILDPLKQLDYLEIVNNLVIESLNKQAEKKFENDNDRILLEDYLEQQCNLSEELIKIVL